MNLPSHILHSPEALPVTNIKTNASGNLFCTSEVTGWSLYSVYPFRQLYSRKSPPNVSIKYALQLYDSNIVFLVGQQSPLSSSHHTPSSTAPSSCPSSLTSFSHLFAPNKVLVWDDAAQRPISHLEFNENIINLAARRDRLIVVLRHRVIVFGLGLGHIGIFREGVYHTCDNPKGLVALATEPKSTLLAFPGRRSGQVALVNLPPLGSILHPPPPSHDPTQPPYPAYAILVAHTSSLASLSTNSSGTLLGTASSKGTLIRVWDPPSKHLIRELRRGSDPAEIFDIKFRDDGEAVCVSSDKGTVHVWHLNSPQPVPIYDDPKHPVSLLKPYLPKYFSSEWSHSSFRLPPPALVPSRHVPLQFLHQPSEDSYSIGENAPTIETDVCICTWVPSSTGEDDLDWQGGADADADADEQEKQKNVGETMSSDNTSGSDEEDDDESKQVLKVKDMDVIVLARSGAWYRLKVAKDVQECKMVEHRRFDRKDGWD